MYLISIYFDEKTNTSIRHLMTRVAQKTGNTYMIDNQVPPHITIGAFEGQEDEVAKTIFANAVCNMYQDTIQWVSVGCFLPYVIYLMPVLNEYLHSMSHQVFKTLDAEGVEAISKYYCPFQWVPHTTIGKKMSQEQLRLAFEVLQNEFGVMNGRVTHVGLAKTNPYSNLVLVELKQKT